MEVKVEEGKAKLAELAEASEEAWESIKDGLEAAWNSVRSALRDAVDKFEK